MENLGYYNGKFGPLEEMMVPMNDRVCYFGDGVYDATYSRNGVIFALDEHIDRFFNSAGLLRIELPCTKDEMKDILNDMVSKVDSGNNFVYWQATRGTGIRNHAFPKEGKANLIPSVMAAQKTAEAGCDESVFHRGDRVTECAHSNVHIIKDGVFKTHPTDHYILPGIARAHLIRACKANNIPVDETPFTVAELMDADEVIVSSSGSFCLVANEIDGKPVGGKAPELIDTLQKYLVKEFIDATTV